MKMFYGNVPVNSMKVKHYEMNTNDSNLKPSDMQSGIVAYGKGKRIVGTGKAFEFASYGNWTTNLPFVVPAIVNVVQIGSLDYSIRMIVPVGNMALLDFTIPQKIAEVTIDGVTYPITVIVQNGMLTASCEHTINIQLFFGKDNYI